MLDSISSRMLSEWKAYFEIKSERAKEEETTDRLESEAESLAAQARRNAGVDY